MSLYAILCASSAFAASLRRLQDDTEMIALNAVQTPYQMVDSGFSKTKPSPRHHKKGLRRRSDARSHAPMSADDASYAMVGNDDVPAYSMTDASRSYAMVGNDDVPYMMGSDASSLPPRSYAMVGNDDVPAYSMTDASRSYAMVGNDDVPYMMGSDASSLPPRSYAMVGNDDVPYMMGSDASSLPPRSYAMVGNDVLPPHHHYGNRRRPAHPHHRYGKKDRDVEYALMGSDEASLPPAYLDEDDEDTYRMMGGDEDSYTPQDYDEDEEDTDYVVVGVDEDEDDEDAPTYAMIGDDVAARHHRIHRKGLASHRVGLARPHHRMGADEASRGPRRVY